MKDMLRFLCAVLLFLPCMLVLNENLEYWWVNAVGLAYTFCAAGYCAGCRRTMDRMLDELERFERELLNES